MPASERARARANERASEHTRGRAGANERASERTRERAGGRQGRWREHALGGESTLARTRESTCLSASDRSQADWIRHLLQLIQPPKRELPQRSQLADSPRQCLELATPCNRQVAQHRQSDQGICQFLQPVQRQLAARGDEPGAKWRTAMRAARPQHPPLPCARETAADGGRVWSLRRNTTVSQA